MAIELNRVGWENGTLVSPAKVNVGGTIYDVTPEQYSGSTPISAENLKEMEDNTEDAINLLSATILYDDQTGTLGNVTLADNVANYNYIEIYFRTSNRSESVKIQDYENKKIILPITIVGTNTYVLLTKEITISGTTITKSSERQFTYEPRAFSETNTIYIYKVLGYK